MAYIAALPMYDWPERQAEVDQEWKRLRKVFLENGIDAPIALARSNSALHDVENGARHEPGDFDLSRLWRHPQLLFAQTCWGPMKLGLERQVRVIGQQDFSNVEGGDGAYYSSAIVMRRHDVRGLQVVAPAGRESALKLYLIRGLRFGFNSTDSMSGYLALKRDLGALGESMSVFDALIKTGSHRTSVQAVASGRVDVASIDARSWQLAQLYEPAANALSIVGWTSKSIGLPFISAFPLNEKLSGSLVSAMNFQSQSS